jgi:hypothetical protein
LLVGLHLGFSGFYYFEVTHFCLGIPNGLERRRSRLQKCQGVAGSGELLKSGQGADDLGISLYQVRGSREHSAAAQPTAGVSGDVFAYCTLVLDFQSFNEVTIPKRSISEG